MTVDRGMGPSRVADSLEFGSAKCVCPKCGEVTAHATRGIPCAWTSCPACGTEMMGDRRHQDPAPRPPLGRQIAAVNSGEKGMAGEKKKRHLRFRCTGCDLQMVLPERPEKCFCCGSTAIVREGWKKRFSRPIKSE